VAIKQQPSVQRNIIANFAGKFGTALLNIAFVPIWMRQMGVESYGLVGAFSSLVVLLSIFDLGLSTTLNRELARRSALTHESALSRNLVGTFEVMFWAIGLLAGLAVVLLGPILAPHWLRAETLSSHELAQAVRLMGVIVICQWPTTLYSAGMQGMQRHVALNAVTLGGAALRTIGGTAVLWLIAPTVQVFFVWQILVSLTQTLLLGRTLRAALPEASALWRFQGSLLSASWRFSGGVAGITLLVAALTQMDRLILSRSVSLEMFGYYSFAATVGIGLNALVLPVSSALFPRLTQLATSRSQTELVRVYHLTCQIVALFVLPLSICVALFSKELLSVWVREPSMVEQSYVLVSLLTIGTALNSIMAIPYNLQLAHGWTALSVYKNVLAVAILPVAIVLLVQRWGTVGAAASWIGLNAGYVLFEIPVMHRRLLRSEMWRWYIVDVALPLGIALPLLLVARMWIPYDDVSWGAIAKIGVTYAVTCLAVFGSLPALRQWAIGNLRHRIPPSVLRELGAGVDSWHS